MRRGTKGLRRKEAKGPGKELEGEEEAKGPWIANRRNGECERGWEWEAKDELG